MKRFVQPDGVSSHAMCSMTSPVPGGSIPELVSARRVRPRIFASSTLWLFAILPLALVLAAGCSKKPPLEVDPNGDVGMPTTDANAGRNTSDPGDTGGQDTTDRSLEDVFFEYDRFALRPEARRVLDANSTLMKANPDWVVILEGHCDERGTVEYNLALGEKRARSAKDYMAQQGVEATRMRTISYGEERPFDRGHSESSWAQNRRVHFVQQ